MSKLQNICPGYKALLPYCPELVLLLAYLESLWQFLNVSRETLGLEDIALKRYELRPSSRVHNSLLVYFESLEFFLNLL